MPDGDELLLYLALEVDEPCSFGDFFAQARLISSFFSRSSFSFTALRMKSEYSPFIEQRSFTWSMTPLGNLTVIETSSVCSVRITHSLIAIP